MKDWLGQEISEGDTIIYAAMSGRSVTMVLATVVKFNDSGSVTVQPVKSSRWEQHSAPTWYVDFRTGKRINPYAPEHVESGGYYLYPDGSRFSGSYRWQRPDGTWDDEQPYQLGMARTALKMVSGTYQPTIFKDHVIKRTGEVKAVTLTVTENITKWTGELPADG